MANATPAAVVTVAPPPRIERQRVGRGALLQVLWRSFFFQAATNYERMQNVGFGYCILPALRRLYRDDALEAAMARHLEFFNSHPYMTGAVLGATIRLEEQIAVGAESESTVRTFKTCTMGPMAAIGDAFFWASLKPFTATLAVAGVFSDVLWAPMVFLLLYNLFHLTLRTYGLFAGYRLGEQVIEKLYEINLVEFSDRSHYLSAICTGFCATLLVQIAARLEPGLEFVSGLTLMSALVLIFFQCLKRKIPMLWLLYGAAALTLVLIASLNAAFPLLRGG